MRCGTGAVAARGVRENTAAKGSNYRFNATTEVNWADGTVTGLSMWNR
jgi:hypothetical protein